MNGVYEPIAIEMLGNGRPRGYSVALGLYVCCDGVLRFFDLVTDSNLRSHEETESREAELEAELRRLRGE